jgi:hypothetical protein
MNTASNVATAATAAASNLTWLDKLRALARLALHLHLQNCAVLAEAHRRPR